MPFLDDFNDNPNDGEKGGVLETRLRYYSERLGCVITLQPGTKSNYGNVPSIFQSLVPRGAEYRPAYYLHDHGYKTKGRLDAVCDSVLGTYSRRFTRYEVDTLMLDAMRELTAHKSLQLWWQFRSRLAWLAVRANVKALWKWEDEYTT